MSMKFRQAGQGSVKDVSERDLRRELDRKEEEYLASKQKNILLIAEEEKKVELPRLLMNAPANTSDILSKYDDADAAVEDSNDDLDSSRCVLSDCHTIFLADSEGS